MGRGAKFGDAFLKVGVDPSKVNKQLRKLQKRFDATGRSLQKIGKIGAGVGIAVAGGLAVAVGIFAGFDDQMRSVKAVTGATTVEFAMLTEQAKKLGATTSFSASQVAGMMAELGRAGFVADEIRASSAEVLALASATGTELPRAAEIAGAALRGFGLEANEMGRVADVLSATANGTAQTLEDLFEGLKPVAPLAAAAGESIEDTAAAIGILANNGIKGSLAGNALARAFKNLANEQKQGELAELGVQAVDAEGNLRPLIEIIGDLDTATAGFGEAQRLATFETLFGRGQAAALKLADASRGSFQELAEGIRNSQGAAMATAAEMEAGIGGSFRRLMSSVEGIAIAVGDVFAPAISDAAERIGGMIGVVTEWVGQNRQFVLGVGLAAAGIGVAGAAVLALGFGLSALGTIVGAIVSLFTILTTVLGAASAAFTFLTAAETIQAVSVALLSSWYALLSTAMTIAATVSGALSAAYAFLTSATAILAAVTTGLAAIVGFLSAAFGVIGAVIGAVLSPIGLIVIAITAVVAGVIYLLSFLNPVQKFFGMLGDLAKWAGGMLKDTLGDTLGWMIGKLKELLSWLGKTAESMGITFGGPEIDKLAEGPPTGAGGAPTLPPMAVQMPPPAAAADLEELVARAEATKKAKADERAKKEAQREAEREAERLAQQAEALKQGVLTPGEEFADTLAEIAELEKRGLLDDDFAQRLRDRAKTERDEALAADLDDAGKDSSDLAKSSGVFNPAAIASLVRVRGEDERIASATESTAENTERIADGIDSLASTGGALTTGA